MGASQDSDNNIWVVLKLWPLLLANLMKRGTKNGTLILGTTHILQNPGGKRLIDWVLGFRAKEVLNRFLLLFKLRITRGPGPYLPNPGMTASSSLNKVISRHILANLARMVDIWRCNALDVHAPKACNGERKLLVRIW